VVEAKHDGIRDVVVVRPRRLPQPAPPVFVRELTPSARIQRVWMVWPDERRWGQGVRAELQISRGRSRRMPRVRENAAKVVEKDHD